jgi:pyruvyltransferase
MADHIRAFWCRVPSRPNVGDALTPWLIHRLTGIYPRFVWPDSPAHKYLVTGSIAALARRSSTVWGAGILCSDDHISPDATLLAVRGPLTRARARATGARSPMVLGDPAMILPRLYAPPAPPPEGIGLALHFSDRPRLAPLRVSERVRVIDMQWPVEVAIDAIRSCELVASSSLHGIIIAHAYGVPATWVEFTPLPSGDGSKFRDHLQCIGSDRDQPLRLDLRQIDEGQLWMHAVSPPEAFDVDALWQSCPFTL